MNEPHEPGAVQISGKAVPACMSGPVLAAPLYTLPLVGVLAVLCCCAVWLSTSMRWLGAAQTGEELQ